MLSALSAQLHARRVILASQSPRRLELLRDCGLAFEVIPSTFEENLPKERFATPVDVQQTPSRLWNRLVTRTSLPQDLYVLENAKQKALEVLRRQAEGGENTVVIGCDTVVVLDGVILEKPKDEDDAFRMLSNLAGRAHDVYSGVALFTPVLGELQPHLFFERTAVAFGPLEPQDIRAYIATGEPMDKAGAYGLQGRAKCFVREIHGCHNNVIGFPVQRFCQELKQLAADGSL